VQIVADGNSIVAGRQDGPQSRGGVVGYLHRNIAPFTLQACTNLAVGGQTIDDMAARAGDVDRAFEQGVANVLAVQEGTNQLGAGDTPRAACDKLLAYVHARREARRWAAVVVATAPPAYLAGDQRHSDAYNARLEEFNDELRARWRGAADALIETRQAGGPFDRARFPDYSRETFAARADLLLVESPSSRSPGCMIHPTASAIAALAPIWAAGLLQLRDRG
jgi:lysophospholipase L1-like esterase